jgi:hypothetical protein
MGVGSPGESGPDVGGRIVAVQPSDNPYRPAVVAAAGEHVQLSVDHARHSAGRTLWHIGLLGPTVRHRVIDIEPWVPAGEPFGRLEEATGHVQLAADDAHTVGVHQRQRELGPGAPPVRGEVVRLDGSSQAKVRVEPTDGIEHRLTQRVVLHPCREVAPRRRHGRLGRPGTTGKEGGGGGRCFCRDGGFRGCGLVAA